MLRKYGAAYINGHCGSTKSYRAVIIIFGATPYMGVLTDATSVIFSAPSLFTSYQRIDIWHETNKYCHHRNLVSYYKRDDGRFWIVRKHRNLLVYNKTIQEKNDYDARAKVKARF